ncbi:MAG: hypothetical protein RIR02_411, partial [Pseudomonadota bacterium]
TVTNSTSGDAKPSGGRVKAVIQPRNEHKSRDGK